MEVLCSIGLVRKMCPSRQPAILEFLQLISSLTLTICFQLEEGEIDVRLNSFKGCFVQRVHRQRP